MRMVVFCLFLAVAVPAAAQTAVTGSSDEAAVRDIVQRYTRARELSDPKAIAALFTADADQFTSSGEWRRGVDALVKGMLETSKRNPGVRAISIAAVRFIAPEVAIVDGDYKTGTSSQRLWTTIVVKREPGGWRIASIRNMAPTGQTR